MKECVMLTKLNLSTIASMAGVSKSTVSMVLNNTGRISDEVRERVWHISKNMHYTPQQLTNKSDLISFFISFSNNNHTILSSPSFNLLHEGLIKILRKNELSTVFSLREDNNRNYLHNICSYRFSEIVTIGEDLFIKKIINYTSSPVITFANDNYVNEKNVYCVITDSYRTGRTIAEEFIRKRHKKIGWIGSDDTLSNREKYNGFFNTLKENKIEHIKEHTLFITVPEDSLCQQIEKFVINNPDLTGIFIQHMRQGQAFLLQLLRKLNRIPGKDIGVIGLEYPDISPFLSPPLTTVNEKMGLAGETIGNIIISLRNGEQVEKMNFVSPEFIDRNSVPQL